jgi:hypothetical protein
MYPTFERSTGWRYDAKYEELPVEIRQQLADIYAPHNEQLFALLGRCVPSVCAFVCTFPVFV